MATAGEVNFGGNINQGEAQIFQERLHPMLAFGAQNDYRKQRNEIDAAKAQQAAQQKRNAEVQKIIDEKFGTPGWFQQEASVDELNKARSATQKYAMENPSADVNSVASQFRNEKDAALRRIGKRNEIQKEIEMLRSDNNPKSTFDNQWLATQGNKVYDRDVDTINRGEVVGLRNHPRAYDADKGIIKAVDDIKSQYNNTVTNEPIDIGFGMRIDGFSKKVRFNTDANGRITDQTVDFVLDSDPAVSQRIRWDIARKNAGVADDTFASPEEMAKIDREYQKVKFSDDPMVVGQVRGKVRQALGQLQQTQFIDRTKIQNYPSSEGTRVKPEDVSNRMVKISAVKNALKEYGPGAQVGTKAQNYLAELKGVAKLNGMPVTNIELVPGSFKKNGEPDKEPQLKITMKSGVESGDVLEHTEYIGVSEPRFEEVMNNLWNSTSATTKEKKITGNALRGEDEVLDADESYDDDGGFLDED